MNAGDLPSPLRFGPFQLKPAQRTLFRAGQPVPLTPKSFQTLLVLVENRDRVVPKNELMQKVWPDTIVEENNLDKAVSSLRKALGERPSDHHYIVTLPGQGYRFVAEVESVAASPSSPALTAASARHFSLRNFSAPAVLVLLGAVVAGIFLAEFVFRRPAPKAAAGPRPPVFSAAAASPVRASAGMLPVNGEIAGGSSHPGTQSIQAYDNLERARFFESKRTKAGLETAITWFHRALSSDPHYAQAHVGIANCYELLGFYGFLPSSETFPKAEAEARRAIRSDPMLPQAHATLLSAMTDYDWNWSGARTEFDRAVSLDPNYARAYQWYGYAQLATGNLRAATANMRRALEIHPLSPSIGTSLAWALYLSSSYSMSANRLRETLALHPDFVPALQLLTYIHSRTHDFAGARRSLEKARHLVPPADPVDPVLAAYLDALSNHPRRAAARLRALDPVLQSDSAAAYFAAGAWTALGKRAPALRLLDASLRSRSNWIIYVGVDPQFAPLRSQPGFHALLKALGLASLAPNGAVVAASTALLPGSTHNLPAHELYVKGIELWSRRDTPSLDRAMNLFHQAIRLDPSYARAYAGLADSYAVMAVNEQLPTGVAVPMVHVEARKALAFDPRLSGPYAAMGLVDSICDWQWNRANAEFRRAIALNPLNATAYQWAAINLTIMGKFAEADVQFQKAEDLAPLSWMIAEDHAENFYYWRRYNAAAHYILSVVGIRNARILLGAVYIAEGKMQLARQDFRKQGREFPGFPAMISLLMAETYAVGHNTRRARQYLAKALQDPRTLQLQPVRIAAVYAALGQKRECFSWLEKAIAVHSPDVPYLHISPQFDPVRADPRFQALIAKIGSGS